MAICFAVCSIAAPTETGHLPMTGIVPGNTLSIRHNYSDFDPFTTGQRVLGVSRVKVLVASNDRVMRATSSDTVRFTTHCYEPEFQPDKDICMLLEPRKMCHQLEESNHSLTFKYVVTFKGNALMTTPGMLRLNLMGMTNERLGIYIALRCTETSHLRPGERNIHRPNLCYRTGVDFDAFDYCDLMSNTIYGLVPEGRQFATYRFLEVVCSGTIPVLYTEKSKVFWPFTSVFSDAEWLQCVRVVRQPYEIMKMAFEFITACTKIRDRICDKNTRMRMYQNELELFVNKKYS